MFLSIIIVNYHQENFLQNCLKSLKQAALKFDYEIIIVDNAFTAASKEVLIDWEKTNSNSQIIFNEKNVGYAKANNQGIRAAKGKYILIMNPDIIILPGAIETLIDLLEQDSSIGLVGPQLLNLDGTIQNSCRRFPRFYTPIARRTFLGRWFKKELKRYLMLDFDRQQTKEVDWLVGACLVTKKQILERIDFFDERYFLYLEDTDLARKIKQLGFKVIYLPRAKMYHFYQRSSEGRGISNLFKKTVWIHIISALKYFYKWR